MSSLQIGDGVGEVKARSAASLLGGGRVNDARLGYPENRNQPVLLAALDKMKFANLAG
jgi:hypothetical protein